ncbi:MAG: RDD family protein [Candidatus Methylarchaceae archaeon HK02M2]|nr:RDD family protein [Candidatus Methylarchaceae archaeon HK02M2]
MPFCSKCSNQIPEDAKFCSVCGTPVPIQEVPSEEPSTLLTTRTGLDRIGSDKNLQDHWIKRIIAIIIDSIIVFIASWILLMFIIVPIIISGVLFYGWFFNWFLFPFFTGIILVLYSSFLESAYGWSLGKKIMELDVTTLDGKRASIDKTFIRNFSKIYVALLLLDLIVGLATEGDPHQKYSDRIAGTTVRHIPK